MRKTSGFFYHCVVNGIVLFLFDSTLLLRIPPVLGQIQGTGISISPSSNYQETSLSPNQVIPVTTSGIPTGTGFSVLQAHTNFLPITISYAQALTPGQFTNGSSVGLVLNGSVASTVYIRNENPVAINVLLILNVYPNDAPIPGGCNMEVPIKTAPFLPTSFSQSVLSIEYPLGSWPLNVRPATCDRAPLQYDIYLYYLTERDFTERTAFDSIRLMSNVTSIETYGTKVQFNGIPPSKIKFANYAGTGRVVAVVLRTLTASAAYIPTLSYGCLPTSENEDEVCDVFRSTGAKLLSAWLVFAGLFLVSLGHRYYKCQLFLFGFLISSVVFYVGLLLTISVGNTVAGTTSTVIGAVGGAVWVTIWAKCGTPIGPVFLASFLLGTLFASILAFTPLADFGLMKDDATFWLAYFCLVLAIPVMIVSFDKVTSILVSAVVGAYIFTVPVDHYVGSNLTYIFLNIMRRATDKDFSSAIIQPPFQTLDIVLTFVWAGIAAVGIIFQLWREKHRAPFPPAPRSPAGWPTRRLNDESNSDFPNPRVYTERSPLLPS